MTASASARAAWSALHVEPPCPHTHDGSLAFARLPRSVASPDRWRRRPLLDNADILPQRRLKVDGPAMLAQKIGERLVGA
jgi:hypothetical protein